MWTPYTGDAEIEVPTNKNLKKALSRLKEIRPDLKLTGYYGDDKGTFGFSAEDLVLVAKEAPYGFIVSVNESIVDDCEKAEKNIVMYIGKNDKFYLYNPKTIKVHTDFENKRGPHTMLNFKIGLGTNYEEMLKINQE